MKQMVETRQAPFYTDIARELGVSVAEGRKALRDLFAEMIPCWLATTSAKGLSTEPKL